MKNTKKKTKKKQTKAETYLEREKADRKLSRQLDLASFEQMVKSLPKRQRQKKHLVVGARAFSMQDILDEIRGEKAYGEHFRGVLKDVRLAITRLRGAKR